jgi:head-tail adaptor
MIRTHVKLGQLRNEATLQTLVETVDQYGQPVQDWDDTGDPIPCEIRTASGRDTANALDPLAVTDLDRVRVMLILRCPPLQYSKV